MYGKSFICLLIFSCIIAPVLAWGPALPFARHHNDSSLIQLFEDA
jgi:hypothetical protein